MTRPPLTRPRRRRPYRRPSPLPSPPSPSPFTRVPSPFTRVRKCPTQLERIRAFIVPFYLVSLEKKSGFSLSGFSALPVLFALSTRSAGRRPALFSTVRWECGPQARTGTGSAGRRPALGVEVFPLCEVWVAASDRATGGLEYGVTRGGAPERSPALTYASTRSTLGAASHDFLSEDLKRASHGTEPEVLRLKPGTASCPDPTILGNRLKRNGPPADCALSSGAALRTPANGNGGVPALLGGVDDGKTIDG